MKKHKSALQLATIYCRVTQELNNVVNDISIYRMTPNIKMERSIKRKVKIVERYRERERQRWERERERERGEYMYSDHQGRTPTHLPNVYNVNEPSGIDRL